MSIIKPLFLIGLRASGKTSLGKKLKIRLDLPLFDTDEMIQKEYKMDIATMVEKHGWQYFREQESLLLKSIPLEPCIVSTGGGVVLSEDNRNYLKSNGYCVYLNPPISSLVLRLMYNPLQSQRPQLSQENFSSVTENLINAKVQENKDESLTEEVTRLFQKRDSLYREVADFTIDTSKEMQSIIEQIISKIM